MWFSSQYTYPDAGTAAIIKDSMDLRWQRCSIQPPTQNQSEHVMMQIQPILLYFIVREQIFAFAICVVSSIVLIDILPN